MIYILLCFVFFLLVGVYFVYKLGHANGRKETRLDILNDTLRQEEVKRNDYITKLKGIEQMPKLKTTSTINSALASQLLSGKVIKFKNTKT